jgi:hypothetical protein
MEYLKEHTYLTTADHFGITETQVSRIKKRNESNIQKKQPCYFCRRLTEGTIQMADQQIVPCCSECYDQRETNPLYPAPAPSPGPLPSPPKPIAKIQMPDQGPAAPVEKEPEPPKPKIRREPAPEVLEYTKEKLKAITMEELADDPKKWADYLRQLPNVWGGTRKGGSGWSTGMLAAFDILATALNKRAKKFNQ